MLKFVIKKGELTHLYCSDIYYWMIPTQTCNFVVVNIILPYEQYNTPISLLYACVVRACMDVMLLSTVLGANSKQPISGDSNGLPWVAVPRYI